MALNDTTLGGGAAHSGTAAPGRTDELNVCSGCGFDTDRTLVGKDGLTYAVCADCEVNLREAEAEGWDETELLNPEEVPCADCGKEAATIRFVHLWKGEFWLCRSCWHWADHEDDYLETCTCGSQRIYKAEEHKVVCGDCHREIKHVVHCQCPLAPTLTEHPNHCIFCKGFVAPPKNE